MYNAMEGVDFLSTNNKHLKEKFKTRVLLLVKTLHTNRHSSLSKETNQRLRYEKELRIRSINVNAS